MGLRGPPKQPTKIRMLRGNPSNKPLNNDEPMPEPLKSIEPPDWLTGEGAIRWRKDLRLLQSTGIITELDYNAFGRLCDLHAKYLQIRQQLEDQDMIISGINSKGQPYQIVNPLFYLMTSIIKELTKLEMLFGMTPSSRANIKVTSQADLETEQFLFGD